MAWQIYNDDWTLLIAEYTCMEQMISDINDLGNDIRQINIKEL